MDSQPSIVVVESDSSELTSTVSMLEAAGYRVASASAFDAAKELLAHHTPDLLITGIRLGPYNGLHLVLRTRADHPSMAAIVTNRYRDAVLEAEAEKYHAAYIIRPLADVDFLSAIARTLQRPVNDSSSLSSSSPVST